MYKPKITLDNLGVGDGFELIQRASKVLSAYGMIDEAKEIHQEATIVGYNFYKCLKILTKYMEI